MSRVVKAVVGLSRGRVAFFDPLSNVLLDLARPTAYVYEGTNTKDLISHLGGAIYVVSGSLFDEVKEEVPEVKAEPKVEKIEQKEQPVEEAVEAKEEVKAEEKPAVTETKPAKATAKKKK